MKRETHNCKRALQVDMDMRPAIMGAKNRIKLDADSSHSEDQ